MHSKNKRLHLLNLNRQSDPILGTFQPPHRLCGNEICGKQKTTQQQKNKHGNCTMKCFFFFETEKGCRRFIWLGNGPALQSGGRKKWSRARASRPDSRPGELEVLLCVRWTGCVCLCVCMCVSERGGLQGAGGRWCSLLGGSGPLAGGCSENRN